MKFHSAEAEELRRAVIAGKYRDAQPLARTLTENRWTPHLAPTWQQYMTPVYTAAKGYVTATSTAQAARAIGRLGAACAACHAALRGPSLPEPSARPSDAPMAGHAWAVERLWQGLVTPSGEAWSLGAEELSKNPPLRSDIEAIDRAAAKLQALGKQAASTADSERAGAFAEVLTTCAGCHRLVGHAP